MRCIHECNLKQNIAAVRYTTSRICSIFGTSLVVQWLRLQAPNAGGLGSIAGQGSRSHMPQKRIRMPVPKDPRLKIPCATTKTWNSQINIKRRRICSVFNELKMNVINLLLAWPHAMKALRPKEI